MTAAVMAKTSKMSNLFGEIVATGATKAEVEALIHDAIALHLAGMREDGLAIPMPSSQVEYIDVAA